MTPRRALPARIACISIACLAFGEVGLPAQTTGFSRVGAIAVPAELVRVQGQRAYLAAGEMLTVVDVSAPDMPKVVGTYTFPSRIWGFRIAGDLAYVGADRSGLGILDVSKDVPVLRGSLETPGQAKSVSVSGATALVTDTLSGVDVVDVRDPAKPILLGSAFLEGFSTDVVISGTWAYAADRPTGFYVFDLSKPEPFEPVSSLQSGVPNNTQRAQLEVLSESSDRRRIVMLVAGGLLQMFDVTNPRVPVTLSPFRTPGGAQRVELKGRRAYVADGGEGLQVVDLTSPSSPRIVGSFKTASPARDVAVEGPLVLLALAGGEVVILREGP